MLTGVQLGVGSSRPSSQGGCRPRSAGPWGPGPPPSAHRFSGPGDQGHVGGDDPRDGGLRDAVDLGEQLLGQVVSQVGQCQAHAQEQTQHPGTEGRQVGTGGVNALAQVHNLAAGNPRATIRDGGLLPEVF